ncbi:TPA: SPI-2 type III secretion system effector PipB [Salmonella enterica subsp. arizonae serovar 13,22:z4,z23:-]|nr:type III secretion system effector PipB [Salmonella enterica]EDV9233388.1 SPI-2 type III secretion system effector PipB [Salmonella enterica subsp. arizonae]HBJ6279542.1 SPI-2 type III secretion system effector PipB [Salmonella enterica subsp. arizonae serovar 13,22:z4,z23:-]EAM5124398.1 type III secretion system effector PipB [Salmonella enterica]EAN1751289.1 type III secretion system effector PipB [Salmonella enterica]
MPIIQPKPEDIARYLCAAGAGTQAAIKEATTPQGLCQWIMNFFTFGGVRRSHEMHYQEVMKKLTSALLHINKNDFNSGAKIFLEDINGCTTCFSRGTPSDSGIDAKVTIEVTKNGKTVTGQVYSKEFWNICRMLVLMQAHNIPLKVENALLTPDGFMNLCGVDLSYKDLQGEDLSGMDASGANFTGAKLCGATLDSVFLCNATFCGANLSSATISFANMTDANLNDTDLTHARVKQATLTGATMIGANLTNAVLEYTPLHGANMSRATLTNTTLTGINIKDARDTAPSASAAFVDDDENPFTIFRKQLEATNSRSVQDSPDIQYSPPTYQSGWV